MNNKENEGNSRRDFVKNSAKALGGLAILSSTPGFVFKHNTTVRLRRNIEDLSQKELDDYIRAIELLGRDYRSLALIHGNHCLHGDDLFFPWHRSLLYTFEKALQDKVPGVTIPYYDYTKIPKGGKRFPKAFEKGESILTKRLQGNRWVANNRRQGEIRSPFYNFISDVRDVIQHNPEWRKSNKSTGGDANGFAGNKEGSDNNKGAIEDPQHDMMHARYIGGVMGFPPTAAYDPIFWSFHAYQDLIFELWLKKYGGRNIPEQNRTLKNIDSANPLTVKAVLDTKELGYIYEHPEFDSFESSLVANNNHIILSGSYAQQYPHVAELARSKETFVIHNEPLRITENNLKEIYYMINDFKVSEQFNYAGFVFLHPSEDAYDNSELFVEKYLVDHFSVLSMRPMDRAMNTDLDFRFTDEMNRLSRQSPGQSYQITVTLVASKSQENITTSPPNSSTRFFESTTYEQID